jgi:hypothetical protein
MRWIGESEGEGEWEGSLEKRDEASNFHKFRSEEIH